MRSNFTGLDVIRWSASGKLFLNLSSDLKKLHASELYASDVHLVIILILFCYECEF